MVDISSVFECWLNAKSKCDMFHDEMKKHENFCETGNLVTYCKYMALKKKYNDHDTKVVIAKRIYDAYNAIMIENRESNNVVSDRVHSHMLLQYKRTCDQLHKVLKQSNEKTLSHRLILKEKVDGRNYDLASLCVLREHIMEQAKAALFVAIMRRNKAIDCKRGAFCCELCNFLIHNADVERKNRIVAQSEYVLQCVTNACSVLSIFLGDTPTLLLKRTRIANQRFAQA
jgi:hypothetical protein